MPGEARDGIVFNVGEGDQHHVGDQHCTVGWCGFSTDFPRPCATEGCTGLVHASFGDENYDGDYWLYLKCDKCGGSEHQ